MNENVSKEMIDCMLIYPYLEDANWKNELRSKDNLALGYLASCLRQVGYTVKIIHAEHNKYSSEDVKNLVLQYKPKTIGISLTAQRAYPVVKEYIEKIKSVHEAPIFLGGIFPTIAYESILNDCHILDAICLGEGEKFVVEFNNAVIKGNGDFSNISGVAYRNKNGDIITDKKQNIVEDLDKLPLPAKDFFDEMKDEINSGFYYAHISAGRGCYGNCSFCSMSSLTGTNRRRVRSPKNVVDEIKYLQDKYGINCFYFVDELFIDKTNLKWIDDFCDEIKKQKIKILFHIEARVDSISKPVIEKLKEVGLDNVFMGFESGNQQMLNRYRKGHTLAAAEEAIKTLRDLDVTTEYGYIMIDPNLSFEQLTDNINWILKIGGYTKHNLYNKLNLYYGTDLYKTIKENAQDGLPFYERKLSYFEDNRVESFSLLIDKSKELFSFYNDKVNNYILAKVKEYKNTQNWQDIAEKINDSEIIVWEKIIRDALERAEHLRGVDKEWREYIAKHIEFLDNNLREIIEQPSYENSDRIIIDKQSKIKRFRPL